MKCKTYLFLFVADLENVLALEGRLVRVDLKVLIVVSTIIKCSLLKTIK